VTLIPPAQPAQPNARPNPNAIDDFIGWSP
jgi:hypothetical protein